MSIYYHSIAFSINLMCMNVMSKKNGIYFTLLAINSKERDKKKKYINKNNKE